MNASSRITHALAVVVMAMAIALAFCVESAYAAESANADARAGESTPAAASKQAPATTGGGAASEAAATAEDASTSAPAPSQPTSSVPQAASPKAEQAVQDDGTPQADAAGPVEAESTRAQQTLSQAGVASPAAAEEDSGKGSATACPPSAPEKQAVTADAADKAAKTSDAAAAQKASPAAKPAKAASTSAKAKGGAGASAKAASSSTPAKAGAVAKAAPAETAKQSSPASKKAAAAKQPAPAKSAKKALATQANAASGAKAAPAQKAKAAAKPYTGKGDLKAGTYYLSSALLASQVVDVDGASNANGANVISWHVNGGQNEQWKLELGKDGYALLVSVKSGKVLEIAGGKAVAGANVRQWARKSGNAANQKWVVKKEGGYYLIRSALGKNLVLDLEGASRKDGTNVLVWTRNGGKNQLFSFIPAKASAATPGKRTVKDGVYQIKANSANGRRIDIEGASLKSGANALAWDANGGANQAFAFAYDGKGYYTVTSVKSGKKLAPAATCSVPGINVGQYTLGNVDRAKWKVEKTGATYRLVNKATGLSLALSSGSANGTNVQTWKSANAKSQQFGLQGQPIVRTGAVELEVAAGADIVLDVYGNRLDSGAAVGTYRASHAMNQRFLVSKQGSGYTIRPFNSRLYLTASTKNTVVQEAARKGFGRQVWKPVVSNGLVSFVNATTGTALDVGKAPSKAASSVSLKKASGSAAQKLYMRPADIVTEGVYYLTSSAKTGQVVDVEGARRTNDANVDLWSMNGGNNQKFSIERAGSGTYIIRNVSTGRVLDVSGASKKNGANVAMYSYNGGANQKWQPVLNNDFSLSFKSLGSGMMLDMAGGKTSNGTNIDVRRKSSAQAQRFWLRETSRDTSEVVQIGVPCYLQNPELPTGCESVALTNALRYWGFGLGKATIANSWMPYGGDGVYNFIGNPRDQSGWIICAPGIANTANSYLKSKGSGLRARNVTGTSLSDLRKYLDKGDPVVVWTTIGMGQPGAVSTYRHGYPLRSNNHAVVLTGYNPNNGRYQVADSLAGVVWRSGGAFGSLYNAMGKQAVVIGD